MLIIVIFELLVTEKPMMKALNELFSIGKCRVIKLCSIMLQLSKFHTDQTYFSKYLVNLNSNSEPPKDVRPVPNAAPFLFDHCHAMFVNRYTTQSELSSMQVLVRRLNQQSLQSRSKVEPIQVWFGK